MKNQDRYKTAQERAEAFLRYCDCNSCDDCKLDDKRILVSRLNDHVCLAFWLDLEAEDEPLPCPFCGDSCYSTKREFGKFVVCCSNGGCKYRSGEYDTENDAIAAHNRVAKAVRENEVK